MQTDKNFWQDENILTTIASGGVVVMPTDTIYGIICSALDEVTVNRVYEIRNRAPEKPCIILISDFSEVQKFGVALSLDQVNKISEFSGPVSVVLDCFEEKFSYLHRGTKTLAFRVPTQPTLRDLLYKTGPLIAPSANIEGLPPAQNIIEAKNYFGDKVDLYVDVGDINGKASKVIRVNADGSHTILRS